jgi:hypothetical protein
LLITQKQGQGSILTSVIKTIPLLATISFLKETKIATKGWLTKRREREEIDEEED